MEVIIVEGDDYDETRLDIKEHLGHIQDRKKAARKVSTIIEKGQYNYRLLLGVEKN